MKPSNTINSEFAATARINTFGDVRLMLSNTMLALARKEISATDALAMAKTADAIATQCAVELKILKAKIELGGSAVKIGKAVAMGRELIGTPLATDSEE